MFRQSSRSCTSWTQVRILTARIDFRSWHKSNQTPFTELAVHFCLKYGVDYTIWININRKIITSLSAELSAFDLDLWILFVNIFLNFRRVVLEWDSGSTAVRDKYRFHYSFTDWGSPLLYHIPSVLPEECHSIALKWITITSFQNSYSFLPTFKLFYWTVRKTPIKELSLLNVEFWCLVFLSRLFPSPYIFMTLVLVKLLIAIKKSKQAMYIKQWPSWERVTNSNDE